MDKETILIVDDESININIVAEILFGKYNLKVATNGFDALEIVKKEKPDLILLDIMMPLMDGFEVAKFIKHNDEMANTPIIFLTAKHDAQSITKSFQNGASDYISKPFLREELLARIDSHLQIKKLNKSLIATLDELYSKVAELKVFQNHLEDKVKEEISKRKEQEKILYQQSKMAAVGEMMDAVAHQWKQPISIIKMQIDFMGYDFDDNLINKEYVHNFQKKVFIQIDHIQNTLKEFRSFFRTNKGQEEFDIKTIIEKVLILVNDELIGNQIEVILNIQNNFILLGIENEFKHLIINLLNNAKDAFVENNISDRKIIINLFCDANTKTMEVIDNAGGIPKSIIDNIFKANFTTKSEDKGTGIGLYISSQIATKYNGTLLVENVESGAKFTFSQQIQ